MNESQASEEDIFKFANQLPTPEIRMEYLKQVCSGSAQIERIVQLLKASTDHSFLENGPELPTMTESHSMALERPGETIGPFKLLQQIGEGGFGVVYMAEQTKPVRRKVALKIIKPGMDTKQVVARFEAERQALALMDHPNIAKIYDGGTTASGRPYFVMELVKGESITTFCDENKLDLPSRLNLFITICNAIQHAHHKGVIHRDIKPSNVLITLHDGEPVPKVIDFGVAKAMSQQLTEKTMFTAHGQMIGTPQYMSPEQAEMSGLDIDTRTDIYSLGILLYELLTGYTPLDPVKLRNTLYMDLQRMIKEDEPQIPSKKYSASGDQSIALATRRKTDPQKLGQLLRGELDWIVMKTLDKDRNRRYESPKALAADVENYLNNDTVEACPPSLGYQFQKFARRHTILFRCAAAIFAALLLGVIASTALWLDADEARKSATKEAASAKAITEFLFKDIIAAADPAEESNRDITLRQVLDQATERLDSKFEDTPLVEAAIKFRLGTAYSGLGERDRTYQLAYSAYMIRKKQLGPEDPNTLESMEFLLRNSWLDQLNEERRLTLIKELLEIRRKLGDNHPNTLRARELAIAERQYIDRLNLAPQRLTEDETELKKILDKQKTLLGDKHPDVLQTMQTLHHNYSKQEGRHDDVVALLKELLQKQQEVYGKNHPQTIRTMSYMARAYIDNNSVVENKTFLEEAFELARDVLGEQHRSTLGIAKALVQVHINLGELKKALAPLKTLASNTNEAYIRSANKFKMAILLAWLDDPTYDSHARAYFAESISTQDPALAQSSTKAVLVMPGVITEDLHELAAVQMRNANPYGDVEDKNYRNFLFALGLAEFRDGNYEEADLILKNIQKAQKDQTSQVKFSALPYQAMIQHHLGDPAHAKKLLNEAKVLIDAHPIEGPYWQGMIIAKMGLKEAIALIEPEAEAEPETSSQ